MTTVAVLASVLAIGPANAGSAVIEIDQVGGRDVKAGEVKGKLFGKTLAEGIAIPSSAAPDAPASSGSTPTSPRSSSATCHRTGCACPRPGCEPSGRCSRTSTAIC